MSDDAKQASLNDVVEEYSEEADEGEQDAEDTHKINQSRYWGQIPADWSLINNPEDIYVVNPSHEPDTDENTYIEMDALDTELPHPKYFGTREAADYSGKKFTEGDVLFARITPCTENGKAALVPEMDSRVGIGSTEYAVLSPDTDKLVPHFLYYLAKSHPIHDYAISRMRGSTGRQRVPFDVFRREIDVPLPPLPEQRKIASVLYNVDEAIRKTEEIIEQTKRVRKGIFQTVFETGVTNSDTKSVRLLSIDATIPEHWEVTSIEEISSKVTDGAHLTPEKSDFGYYLLGARNVQNGYVDLQDPDYVSEDEYERLISKCQPEPNDILMSCRGVGLGRVAVVPEGLESALLCSAALIKLDSSVHPDYVEKALRYVGAQKQIKALQTQSAQPNLFQNEIAALQIPLPPIEEQKEIAGMLSDYDDKIELEERYADRLHRLKRGLMQDLLKGEIRTADRDIDVLPEVEAHG